MTEIWRKITNQDIRNTLAIGLLVGAIAFLFRLMSHPIPETNKDAINLIGGIVIGQVPQVYQYFFGQSKTEVDKTKADNASS